MNTLRSFFVLLLLALGFSSGANAQQAWLDPEVLAKQEAIQLSDAQKPYFQASLTQYLQDVPPMIQKTVRTSKGNLDKEIRRGNRKLLKVMNGQMGKILSEEQYPLYEDYRDTLVKKMF